MPQTTDVEQHTDRFGLVRISDRYSVMTFDGQPAAVFVVRGRFRKRTEAHVRCNGKTITYTGPEYVRHARWAILANS